MRLQANDALLAPIVQLPLGRLAADRLRGLVLAGELGPGTALKERELALALGVSRTPIRDALTALEVEGLVVVEGRHFVVAPLDPDEIAEIYAMLAALERAAVQGLTLPADELLILLAACRGSKAAAGADVRGRVDADAAWHRTLVEASGNQRLRDCTERLRTVATRYELAFFGDASASSNSLAEHEAIERLVRAGDLGEAASAIEEHWLGNIESMSRAIGRR